MTHILVGKFININICCRKKEGIAEAMECLTYHNDPNRKHCSTKYGIAKEIGMQKIVEELKKLSDKHGVFYEPDPLLLSMC